MALLTPRERKILLAAVSEFITTAEPVSSRSLQETLPIKLSSASIRAVLATLEANGYLTKPHTSAGRVPTARALSLFAEALADTESLASPHQSELDRRYAGVAPGIDALMQLTGKVLAELTGSAAVVLPPRGERWVLRDLRFISLNPREILVVIVSSHGAVENRVLRVEQPVTSSELERLNNLMQPRIEGRTLNEVRASFATEIVEARRKNDQSTRRTLEAAQEALAEVASDSEVLVEGAALLLERPEFASADRTRQLVRTLEDEELIVKLLDRALMTPGLQVVFGSSENEMGSELSLVAAGFGAGAVGVLGSTRMDYSSVVPLVRQTARRLYQMLETPDEPGKPSGH